MTEKRLNSLNKGTVPYFYPLNVSKPLKGRGQCHANCHGSLQASGFSITSLRSSMILLTRIFGIPLLWEASYLYFGRRLDLTKHVVSGTPLTKGVEDGVPGCMRCCGD